MRFQFEVFENRLPLNSLVRLALRKRAHVQKRDGEDRRHHADAIITRTVRITPSSCCPSGLCSRMSGYLLIYRGPRYDQLAQVHAQREVDES